MPRILVLLTLLALGSGFAQQGGGYTFANVVQFVELNEGFDVLEDAFERSGVADRYAERGPFTLFAPNDDAFAALEQERLDALMNDADALEGYLAGYLVPARLTHDELVTQARERGTALVRTVADTVLEFTVSGEGRLMINGNATVAQGEIPAENGTIFVIDRVLEDAVTGDRGGDPLPGMGQ